MRTVYTLSESTLAVLSHNVPAIAKEWDKNPSYLYQILSGVECDPLAKFLPLYAAAVRAGADVSPWDAALSEVRSRYALCNKNPVQCLTDKIATNAETTSKLVTALKDGQIDEREARNIRKTIAKERASLDDLEAMLPNRSLANPTEISRFKNGGGR
jgi:hypothetical protein